MKKPSPTPAPEMAWPWWEKLSISDKVAFIFGAMTLLAVVAAVPSGLTMTAIILVTFGVGLSLVLKILKPLQQLAKALPEAAKDVVAQPSTIEIPTPRDEAAALSQMFERILEDSRLKKVKMEQLVKEQAGRVKEMDRALEKKVYDLFTLFEVAKELNATLDPEAILKTVVFTCMAHLGVTNTTLMLLDNYLDQTATPTGFEPMMMHGLDERLKLEIRFAMDSDFVKFLAKTGRPVTRQELEELLLSDADSQALAKLQYAICAPLAVKDQIKGMLFIGPKKSATQTFTQANMELLGTLIGLAALALENARLYTLAITDGLTKVYTHRYLQLRLKEELERSRRYKHPLTVIMVDVDHFKNVNDSFGHLFGDHVLVEVAKCCKQGLRGSDFVSRYGGEEFALVLPEVDDQQALVASERIRKCLENFPFKTPTGQRVTVTASLGIASYPKSATDERELLARADKALYSSKKNGRNQSTLFQ